MVTVVKDVRDHGHLHSHPTSMTQFAFKSSKTIFSKVTVPDLCCFSHQPSVTFSPGCLPFSHSYLLFLLFMTLKYLSILLLGHWLNPGSNLFGYHNDLQTDRVGSLAHLLPVCCQKLSLWDLQNKNKGSIFNERTLEAGPSLSVMPPFIQSSQ